MFKGTRIFRIILVTAAAGVLLLALESFRERNVVEATQQELDRALENVIGRIKAADANQELRTSILNASTLAKARSWAMLVEIDPSVAKDEKRVREFCEKVNVRDLRQLDEKVLEPQLREKSDEEIARTSRVRCGGFVRIERLSEGAGGAGDAGDGEFVRSAVYGGRRVTVGMPAPPSFLAGEWTYVFLVALAGVLHLVILFLTAARAQKMTRADERGVMIMLLSVLTLCLAFESFREVAGVGSCRERLLLGLENVTARLLASDESERTIDTLTKQSNLEMARAFSLIVRADPTILSDDTRLERVRKALGADNVTATDERGKVVISIPKEQVGYNLGDSRQSSVFLPAISNQTFELSVSQFKRGFDGKSFQYACVHRPDRLGALSVGFSSAQIDEYRSVVSKDAVGGRGMDDVFVEVAEGSAAGERRRRGYFDATKNGFRCLCLSAACGERFVTVSLPMPRSWIAGPFVSKATVVLAVLFFLLLQGTLVPETVAAIWNYLRQFFRFFWGLRVEKSDLPGEATRRTFLQDLTSPIVFAALVVYLCVLGMVYQIRYSAEVEKAGVKLVNDARTALAGLSNSVDNMLFGIARAMVRHYRSPDGVSCDMAAELTHRYDVDEASFIDSNGVARVSSFGDIDWPMANGVESGKFNCLLHGVKAYAQPFRGAAEDATVVRKYVGVPFPEVPGYVQIGIDRSRLTGDLRYLFEEHVHARRMSNGGFIIWANGETGEILASGSPRAHSGETLAGVGFNAAVAPEAGEPFDAEFYGERCIVTWLPFAHLRLYAVQPYSGVRIWEILRTAALLLMVVLIIFVILSLRLTTLMTQFSGLAARLKEMMQAEQERQSKDLTLAKTIQSSALPLSFPDEGDFRIYATMKAAREVGGDFYDFYTRPDGKILFVVADVSGKGVPAALFMMRAKAILRAAVFESPHSISTAVRYANENLAENNDAEMFVTAWVGVYDRRTGEIAYVNAGHNPPAIKRADGSVEWIRSKNGLPLAAVGGILYSSGRLTLNVGDSLFLYTDGVTEAENTNLEQYGADRLEAVLAKAQQNIAREVAADVAAFATGAEQFDDITMLVFDRLSEHP